MSQPHDENYNEQPMTRMGRIQQPSRRYRRLRHPSFTAAIWTANNPLLQRGELGTEIDTGKLKVGDGVTYWNDLGYVAASEIAFADITGTPDDNVALKNALDAKQDVLTEGAGIGIDSSNVISNTGVRSIATGTTNGTISVNTNGTTADVSVYGLGSAAYTASGDYATAAQGTKADTAVQPGDLATVATTGEFSDLQNKPTTLSGYGITDGANTDLSNLTSTGANIGNWSSNVSNCITEIPQDIKLELSSGTLTLKAGSKVYVPNGAGVFTEVTIANDISRSAFGSDTGANRYIFPVFSGGTIIGLSWGTPTNVSSGTTPPTNGTFYNESTNYINNYSGGSVADQRGFPIALVTMNSGAVTSIDQVFNEIGYIGSHVFFLPSYSVLTPNGRNTDGTLASRKYTFTACAVYTRNLTGNNIPLWVRYDGTISFSNGVAYDPIMNQSGGGGGYAQVATATLTSGVISNFVPKQVFRAVDYSDTEFIAHQAMPSGTYTNLSLGTTGSTYAAPADGYLTINKSATAAGQYVNFINGSNGMNCNVIATSALPLRLFMPVSKGDVITINYDAAGTTTMFRFIYANGAK